MERYDSVEEIAQMMGSRRLALRSIQEALSTTPRVPVLPRGTRATDVMRAIQRSAAVSWLPMVVQTYAGMLTVDGLAGDLGEAGWDVWRRYNLDAQQHEVHRAVLTAGRAYVGVAGGRCRVYLPDRAYQSPDGFWTVIRVGAWQDHGPRGLLSDVAPESKDLTPVYRVWAGGEYSEYAADGVTRVVGPHPAVPPVLVGLVAEVDAFGDARGVVEPLIPAQEQIALVQMAHLTALHFAAFRQRWASGLVVPDSEEAQLEASAMHLWLTDNPDARFGDFAQTDTTGHRSAYTQAVRTLAAQAQVAPGLLSGDLSNLSAEALSTMEEPTRRRARAMEAQLSEGWERLTRALLAAEGEGTGGSLAVQWRDSTSRAFAATVDGLAKLRQNLDVPAEALWARVPGVTADELASWSDKRSAERDGAWQVEL